MQINLDKQKPQSMLYIITTQFMEHKLAVFGLMIIVFLLVIALFAPLISVIIGIDPNTQNVFHRYVPPMSQVTLPKDAQEAQLELFYDLNPQVISQFVIQLKNNQIISQELNTENGFFEFIETHSIQDATPILKTLNSKESRQILKLYKNFSNRHILGTDELGRDILMRLIFGTRVSIGVGLLVAISSALIGLLIGCLAGYYGGFLDALLMRITDAIMALPILVVLIVLAAIDFKKVPLLEFVVGMENESIIKLVIILCFFSWMPAARLVRGSILSIREQEFILAAKTLGAKDSTLIIRNIIPNIIAPLLIAVTLKVGEAIMWEASLSFLGLGIQPPTPSWGNMLFNALELIHQAPLLAIIPGLMILITVISFNFFGDGLQDALDPKAIHR